MKEVLVGSSFCASATGAAVLVTGGEGLSNTCVGTLCVAEGSYNLNVGVVTTTPCLGANVGVCSIRGGVLVGCEVTGVG